MADEFEPEFDALHKDVQVEILALSLVLEQFGPQLGRPRVDTLNGSRHANMKELRFSAADGEWRVAFAFDPKRTAILLAGGDIGWERKAFLSRVDQEGGCTFRRPCCPAEKGDEIVMSVNVREKIRKLNVTQRKKVEGRAAELIAEEMSLRDLRKARRLTQAGVAKVLGVSQDSISRLEKRSDLLLSTLRKTVKAMGGEVRIVAEFRDRAPVVLCDLSEDRPRRKSVRRRAQAHA